MNHPWAIFHSYVKKIKESKGILIEPEPVTRPYNSGEFHSGLVLETTALHPKTLTSLYQDHPI